MQATPLVPLSLDGGPTIWCKLEFLNPSGSTKDRIARYMLERAWRKGRLSPGDRVIEASSGSTSIALALVCAQMGLRFTAVLPEGVSEERLLLLRAYGADFILVPREQGVLGAVMRAEEEAQKTGAFYTRQFQNPDNAEAHRVCTAPEILSQIPGGQVDVLVSGVGTGGTIMGLAQGFVEAGCSLTAVVARPTRATTVGDLECCFSGRVPGVVEGISNLYRPEELPNLVQLDINDATALHCSRDLIRHGFPVGPSSGLNYAAAVEVARQQPPGSQVMTIFPDRMERYFSTDLFESIRGELANP